MARPKTSDLSMDEQEAILRKRLADLQGQIDRKRTELKAWIGAIALREMEHDWRLWAVLGPVLERECAATFADGKPRKDAQRKRNQRLTKSVQALAQKAPRPKDAPAFAPVIKEGAE